jgi:flagellar secretion chaperone FliS
VSYGSGGYAANAAKYQEMEVMAASPGQLVVLVYDFLLASLKRTRIGMERNDVALRSQHAAKARDALGELLVTLDHDKGAAIASQLGSLYTFFIGELLDLGSRNDLARLDRITIMVQELRDAFAQVAGAGRAVTAA